jgi:hypothetical protein
VEETREILDLAGVTRDRLQFHMIAESGGSQVKRVLKGFFKQLGKVTQVRAKRGGDGKRDKAGGKPEAARKKVSSKKTKPAKRAGGAKKSAGSSKPTGGTKPVKARKGTKRGSSRRHR